jgi:hypothetical protein
LLYYHIVPPLILPGQKTLFLNGAEDILPDYTLIHADAVFIHMNGWVYGPPKWL